MFRSAFKIFLTITCCLSFLCLTILAQPVQADSINVTALINARPQDFQLLLTSQPAPGIVTKGQIITFTLTYGSYLTSSTDSIALTAHWQQDPTDPQILKYIDNSATPAIQGAQPHINLAQQTITWYISPVPPGLNHQVSWQLHVDPQHLGRTDIDLAMTASLTGPGLQLIGQPLRFVYRPTVTTTPTSIGPSPTISQPTGTQPTVTQPTLNPSLNPPTPSATISPEPTISPTGWLAMLTLFLLITFLIWLIRRRFWQMLWLFYRHSTLLHGLISRDNQPLRQVLVTITPLDQSTSLQPLSTVTNQHGHYQLKLRPHHYSLDVIQDGQVIYQQSLTIHSEQRGQRLQLSLDLSANNATINQHDPLHHH